MKDAATYSQALHEFFAAPSGICEDLSRFAVETLRQIDPDAKARYVMIEFSQP